MYINDGSNRNLEDDARDALKRFTETKEKVGLNNLDRETLVVCVSEVAYYLQTYINLHADVKKEKKSIETRRQDHWDLLNKKCSENPMFKDLWEELMTLMCLEEDNSKTDEQIKDLRSKNSQLL